MTKQNKWLSIAIGRIFSEQRNQQKITQDELARSLRVQRTSISNIESGKQVLLIDLFYEICERLNLSPVETLEKAIRSIPHKISPFDPLEEIEMVVKE